jgi:hypothetical protein
MAVSLRSEQKNDTTLFVLGFQAHSRKNRYATAKTEMKPRPRRTNQNFFLTLSASGVLCVKIHKIHHAEKMTHLTRCAVVVCERGMQVWHLLSMLVHFTHYANTTSYWWPGS